jgi:hypothetical protein
MEKVNVTGNATVCGLGVAVMLSFDSGARFTTAVVVGAAEA